MRSGAVIRVSLALALAQAGCSDSNDYCVVSTAADGTVTIECPDSSTELAPCYADLPDLDGNGVMNAADCDLVGVASAMRQMCGQDAIDPWRSDRDRWWSFSECRAVVTTGLAEWMDRSASLLDEEGRAAVVFGTDSGIFLWHDRDGDAMPGESEVVEIPGLAAADSYAAFQFVASNSGCWAVMNGSNLWVDLDCDHVPDEGEVSSLALSDGDVFETALGFRGTQPVVFFLRGDEALPEDVWVLEAWADLNWDLAVTEDELFTLDQLTGYLLGVGHTADGQLMVVAQKAGEAVVYQPSWTGEPPLVRTSNLACHRLVYEPQSASYACEGQYDQSEVVVEIAGRTSSIRFRSAARVHTLSRASGRPFLSATVPSSAELVLWYDRNGDRTAEETEFARTENVTDPTAGEALVVDGSPVFLSAPMQGGVSVETWIPPWALSFLGERCGPQDDVADHPVDRCVEANCWCTGGLECRTSGNAPEPRCVPRDH